MAGFGQYPFGASGNPFGGGPSWTSAPTAAVPLALSTLAPTLSIGTLSIPAPLSLALSTRPITLSYILSPQPVGLGLSLAPIGNVLATNKFPLPVTVTLSILPLPIGALSVVIRPNPLMLVLLTRPPSLGRGVSPFISEVFVGSPWQLEHVAHPTWEVVVEVFSPWELEHEVPRRW